MSQNQIGMTNLRDWIDRAKELMEENGLSTMVDLANKSGLSQGSLNQAMRGMHMPRQATIDKVAAALNTTPQYLLYGDTMVAMTKLPLLRDSYQVRQWVDGGDVDTQELQWVEHTNTPKLSLNAFALAYNHRDMMPAFEPDDLVFFEPCETIEAVMDLQDAFLLAVRDDNEWLFGRYSRTNGGEYIETENPKYPITQLKDGDQIVGIAVQMIRRFTRKRAI